MKPYHCIALSAITHGHKYAHNSLSHDVILKKYKKQLKTRTLANELITDSYCNFISLNPYDVEY